MNRPLIAVTSGDPAGIGPEIIIKALSQQSIHTDSRVAVIGDSRIFAKTIQESNSPLSINCITDPSQGIYSYGTLNLIDMPNVNMDTFMSGKVDAMCGRAAYEYIEASIKLAMDKKVNAVATAPIHKEALRAAGVPYIGHTEIFGALTGTADPLTMFQVGALRIFFLTRHVSLRQACSMVTKERIIDYVKRCSAMLASLRLTTGTMAIAGLNPHCGDGGLFGQEEIEEIQPAVKYLQQQGIAVEGPVSADSVFHLAHQGRYSSVLSLYHDQGHIAAKTLDFERTIAVTGGMPILRTSVDHGTAMDIAGKNLASGVSMEEAIRIAAGYVQSL